jgi:hypothetical protein
MTSLTDALILVEAALERLAVAMATGQPDSVLAAEESIAQSVHQLLMAPRDAADPMLVARQLAKVRVALLACEQMGRAAAGYVQTVMPAAPYTAHGYRQSSAMPATVESRT